MASEPQRDQESGADPSGVVGSTGVDEHLSAYLDNELDDETRRDLETRLAVDPTLRDELTRLERTWNLLDSLESAEVGSSFASSTLEMLAVSVEAELEEAESAAVRTNRRRWTASLVLWAFCFVAGFAGAAAYWPRPNDQVIRLLPILQQLDAYRQITDIDMLRVLHDSGLFASADAFAESIAMADAIDDSSEVSATAGDSGSDAARVPPLSVASEESKEDRRQRIASMSYSDKRLIEKNLELFQTQLNAEQRRRILSLYEQMSQAPDADALEQTMLRFHLWLADLGAETRASLDGLPPSTLVARIAGIQAFEAEERWRNDPRNSLPMELRNEKVEPIENWLNANVPRFTDRLIDRLPPLEREHVREQVRASREGSPAPPLAEAYFWWPRLRSGGDIFNEAVITPQEMDELRSLFSPDARKYLSSLNRSDEWGVIIRLLFADFATNIRQRRARPFSREELVEYFEKGMRDDERERILNAWPSEKTEREIISSYWRSLGAPFEPFGRGGRGGPGGPGMGGGGPGPGGGRGPGGPPPRGNGEVGGAQSGGPPQPWQGPRANGTPLFHGPPASTN